MGRFIAYESRTSRGGSLISIDPDTINALEELIKWAEIEVPHFMRVYMDSLVHRMALVNQMEARKMSYGPYDSSGHNSDLAWKVPVRRITERYYLGWKVKQIGTGVYQLYNDSREAYFIEFGINWMGNGRRVRRPVRKLSLRRTVEYMMRTQAFHRVWVDIYSNPRTRHRGKGFTQHVQSPAMGSFDGPMLGRFLP